MNKKYQQAAFLIIFLTITAIFSSAHAQQQEKKSEVLMIAVGMPKENIYAVYPAQYQLKDYVKGGVEVIVFNDYLTSNKGDTITFYLKDGKVYWKCLECGYIVEASKAPERCPVCDHPQGHFEIWMENY